MRPNSVKGSLLVGLTAALLGGCATHRGETPTPVRYGSIKDSPAPSPYEHGVAHSPRQQVHSAPRRPRIVRAAADAPAVVKMAVVEPAQPRSAAKDAIVKERVAERIETLPPPQTVSEPPKMATAPAPVVVQLPKILEPALPKQAPEALTPQARPAPAAAPVAAAPAPTPLRTTSEGRRADAPVQPTTPPVVPVVPTVPAVPPAATQPAPTQPVPGAQVALQPIPKAPATAPAAPKPAVVTPKIGAPATSELQRVFITRSVDHLKASNISNARAAVNEALRLGETPEALTALANTYDPIVLQNYPRLVALADIPRALELYKKAADAGHKPAQEALAKLQEFNAKRR